MMKSAATSASRVAGRHLRNGASSRAATRRNALTIRRRGGTGQRRHKSSVEIGGKGATTAATTAESSAAAAAAASSKSKGEGFPFAQSMAALAASIATVSGAAAAVEAATSGDAPPFDPAGQRFGQANFAGRFCRMILACDPKLLFYGSARVQAARDMVENYRQYDDGTVATRRALWEAKRVVDAALHPDTGDVIPRPFRMSGYVPFNGPICVAMVASQSTLPLLFWSWVNQSQNALVNYYNRNASSPMSNSTLMTSYAVAVGSALTVAFGLATFIQKRYDANQARMLLRWVAFPSAVVASSLNCYIVRSPEIGTGISLLDGDGNDVMPGEKSNVAAARGVYSTTASRALLQAPVYFIPPVLLGAGGIKTYLSRNPVMTVPVTTFLLLVSFGVGLPATVAIFPQISSLPADKAEEKFQNLRDPQTNKPYDVFYYNKGL